MSVITNNTIQPASGQALTIKDEGGTASITVQTDGDLTLAENAYLGSGKGIYFDGQTTSGNFLDDYETGTFSVTGVSGNSTFSSGSPPTLYTSAQYVKIGKVVTVIASFAYTSTGWNGTQWILGGIPFNPVQLASCSWGITARTQIQSQATHMWTLQTSGLLEGYYMAQNVGAASNLLSENTGGSQRSPNIQFNLTYITS